jgi:hypothetical protein
VLGHRALRVEAGRLTAEDRSRVIAAGYLPCALDPSGTRLLSPDGNRLVTVAGAR